MLSEQQQVRVIEETQRFIHLAEKLLNKKFLMIPVVFNLKGRTIGLYKRVLGQPTIHYNAAIFAKYFDDNLANTVPHEVAHYIVDLRYSIFRRQRIKPHGEQWKALMSDFGADASRTANYDLANIPTRKYTRINYACGCQQHQLGIRRHNKVLQNKARYYCRQCGDVLKVL